MRTSYIVPVVLVLLAVLALASVRVIQDGEAGVRITLGHISDQPLGAGIRICIPILQQIEKWNVKTQEIKEMAQVPSSEGLISSIDVSVIFNVMPDDAPKVRRTIGRNYQAIVLVPFMREAIRSVASGYPVKALFSDEGREQIGAKIRELLIRRLEPRGITIQDVLLRDVKLPPTFLASIEQKLKAEQEALQKEFELQKAVKDAEIEIERAKGVAEANRIVSQSITPEYIQYLWVQGLHDGSSEVIYVPTEANLPILEAVREQMPPLRPAAPK